MARALTRTRLLVGFAIVVAVIPSAVSAETARVSLSEAIYGLRLRVARRLHAVYEQGAKIVIPCSSGRLRIWGGPVWQ